MLVKVLVGTTLAAAATLLYPAAQTPPFGGSSDVAFAKKVWKAMDGYQHWKLTTPVYKGGSPHGKWVRLYATHVTVDGRAYPIIVKDNYGGRGVTKALVDKDPDAWLKAVTIMLQREEGYDTEDHNWFWVKFGKDGTILKNPKGMLLAGRVAKGMPKGCISCHAQAGESDFLFSNDE
ncbi:MAG: hypothetical protein ACE5EX_10705 [Phycisphaerae bacterium]